MTTSEKLVLVEETLTRAAERIGDITAPTMAAYYRRYPDAKEAFETHALGDRPKLEGLMVENALYCLMRWYESPAEIAIMLNDSVRHHQSTLNIPPLWYAGLIEATADVIGDLIPAENDEEVLVWREVREALHRLVAGVPGEGEP